MMLSLYRGVSALGAPVIRGYLAYRRSKGKEDGARFAERLGRPGRDRPAGALVWAHAASVGESLSILPLIERLLAEHPGLNLLLTTGTVTSARLMAARLPKGSFHQYVPVDRVTWVRRFLDHWRPDLALWAESELWPNLVTETARRGTPLILVNGRISPRSYVGWGRVPRLIGAVLRAFDLCLAQADIDAERLTALGAKKVKCVGNLKFSVPPLPVDEAELSRLRDMAAGRPVWLAASTHAGEEEIAARVHRHLAADHPGLLTVIVPRHPDRGSEIQRRLTNKGLNVARRDAGEALDGETDVYLADTLGEMGLFYRLAGIAFMGKSLVPLGGQNPLEPARLGCGVLHGPAMWNFEDITRRLDEAGAALGVADEGALGDAVGRLLREPDTLERMSSAANALFADESSVLDAVAAELAPYLATLKSEEPSRARP